MGLRRLLRPKVIVAVVAAVALLAVGIGLAVALGQPAPLTIRNVRIPVVDGPRGNQHVVIDASFFTPPGGGRLPAVLLAHGFGETKDAVRAQAEDLARAGFAVLTWSARGFGASTGQIGLDSPDYEVKDVEQLVTWLARQPRVLLDHPGDPRVGITGASYGGGISLLAAAYDHRIDAVVAQSTWNNLATALFPNGAGGGPAGGVFKRQWAGLLFTQGSVGFGATAQGSAPGQAAGPGQGQRVGPGQRVKPGQRSRAVAAAQRNRPVRPVRPLPAPDLRHLPAGRRDRPGHSAGHLAAAALQPGQRGGPDARPHAAHPGRERLALRAGPGERQLPGAPPQRRPGGHGVVRRRPRRRQPGNRAGRVADGAVAAAVAGTRPSGGQHRHRAARVRGDPGARLRPVQRPGVARHRHREQLPGAGRDRADPGAAGRAAAGGRQPGRGCARLHLGLPWPRPARAGRTHLRHAGPERGLHLGTAVQPDPGDRVPDGQGQGLRRARRDAVRQDLRRGPGGQRHPAQSAGVAGAGHRGAGRPRGHHRTCPRSTTTSPPGTGCGSC